MDIILLIVRLVVGLGMAAHGVQKLFGWFDGYGLEGTGGFMETLGFKPGVFFARMAGLGETGGGVLLALGFLGPVGPAIIITVMLVAVMTVHWGKGFFTTNNGKELPLLYIMVAVLVAFSGPGVYSLDQLFHLWDLSNYQNAWIAIAVAIVLAAGNLLARKKTAA